MGKESAALLASVVLLMCPKAFPLRVVLQGSRTLSMCFAGAHFKRQCISQDSYKSCLHPKTWGAAWLRLRHQPFPPLPHPSRRSKTLRRSIPDLAQTCNSGSEGLSMGAP